MRPLTRIFNAVDANTVTVDAGVVTIQGIKPFLVADVVSCNRSCTTACVPQVVVVTPVVPSSPCECPWTFDMTIRKINCGFDRVNQIWSHTYHYNYTNPSGDAPTAALIIASVVAQINNDPNSPVVAVDTGNTHTTITLTEKDCNSENPRRCGFQVMGNSLTQTTSTAHVDAILPAWEVKRTFPILPGDAFAQPDNASCGSDYCRYYIKIQSNTGRLDPHLANAVVTDYRELELYVNRADASFLADWDTPLATALVCLGAPLV